MVKKITSRIFVHERQNDNSLTEEEKKELKEFLEQLEEGLKQEGTIDRGSFTKDIED